jgi:hypothetical protein
VTTTAIRRSAQHHRGATGTPGAFVPPAVPAGYRLKYEWTPGTAFDSAEWTIGTGAGNAGNGRRVSSAVTFNATDPSTGGQVIRVRAQATQDPDLSWHLDSGIVFRKGASRSIRNSVRVISVRATQDSTLTMSPVILAWPATGVWAVNGEDDWVEVGGGQSTSTPPGFRRPGGYDHWSVDGVTSGTTANRQSHWDYGATTLSYADYHTYYSEHDGQVHRKHLDAFPASGTGNLITLNNNLFHPTGVGQYSSIQNDATANEANSRFGGNFNSTTFTGCDILVRYYGELLPKTYVLGPTLPTSGTVPLTPGYALEPRGTVDGVTAVTASLQVAGIQQDAVGKSQFVAPWETAAGVAYYAAMKARWVTPDTSNVTRSVNLRLSSDRASMIRCQAGGDRRLRIYKIVSGVLTELTTVTAGQPNSRVDPGAMATNDTLFWSLFANADGSVSLRYATSAGGAALPSIDGLNGQLPVLTIAASQIADAAIPAAGDVAFGLDAATGYATGSTVQNVYAGDVVADVATAATASPITVTGLAPSTTYDLYLEAQNAVTGSGWAPIDNVRVTTGGTDPRATPIFAADFVGGTISNLWGYRAKQSVSNSRFQILDNPDTSARVRVPKVVQMELHNDDIPIPSIPRIQLESEYYWEIGATHYMGFSVWFPTATEAPAATNEFMNVCTIWGPPFGSNGEPVKVLMKRGAGGARMLVHETNTHTGFVHPFTVDPIVPDAWHDFVLKETLSATGSVEWWYNGPNGNATPTGSTWRKLTLLGGSKVYSLATADVENNGSANYVSIRQYRSTNAWLDPKFIMHGEHRLADSWQAAAPVSYGYPPATEPT